MKTVKKQVHLNLESMSLDQEGRCSFGTTDYRFRYEFTGYDNLDNIDTLEVFIEVEEPETIKEFLCENDITKKDLVKWLNKNYK